MSIVLYVRMYVLYEQKRQTIGNILIVIEGLCILPCSIVHAYISNH